MSSTARFRRLAGAACLVAAPLLVTIATVVAPWANSDRLAETIRLYGEHRDALEVADLLFLAGLLLLIPALLAAMRLLRRGAPVLSLVGGSLAIAGAAAAIGLLGSDQILVGLTDPSIRAQAGVALDERTGWILGVMFGTFLIGHALGLVLLGVAALRSRVAPAWAGAALIAAVPVEILAYAAFDAKVVAVAAWVLLLAGFAALAVRVSGAGDREWDADEVPASGAAAAPQAAVTA